MSIKYLGPEFDIHTGGIDHIPVHHNNEIAQSVCAGYPYTRYWMHNAFLTTESEKMAKSGENFITLQTLKEKNIDPLAYRYLLLTAQYSSPLQFSWEALEGAQTALKKLRELMSRGILDTDESDLKITEEYKKKFNEYVNDDLDTPKALALIWEVAKGTLSQKEKRDLILEFDKVLGLRLDKIETFEIPENIELLIKNRDKARADEDFTKSDEIRKEIEVLGYEVKDTPEGTVVTPR